MNKNTLARLKTELGEYREALPVFEMKEQQLKGLVQNLEEATNALKEEIRQMLERVKEWASVMAEKDTGLSDLVKLVRVDTEKQEIVGVTVENFIEIHFDKKQPDYLTSPLWVDEAVDTIVDQKTNQAILHLEQKKLQLLKEELAEARRMKNALKEVFIPEAIQQIRKIEIYLGDVERLAIGCAKLVKKKKLEKKGAS